MMIQRKIRNPNTVITPLLLGIAFLLLAFSWQPLQAQMVEPVSWDYSVKQTGDQTYEVHLTATLNEGWYIYSQYMEEGGPVLTRITFDEDLPVALEGSTQEVGELKTKYEEIFRMETKYYYNKVTFVQQVEYTGPLPLPVTGTITYMSCNGESCTPPMEEPFVVAIQ